jgi:hypothetical protein
MKSKLFRKLEVLSRAEMVAQLSSKTKPPNVAHHPPQTNSRTLLYGRVPERCSATSGARRLTVADISRHYLSSYT